MEEYAYVLDYLPQGSGMSREPLCYAVGEAEFKLFELVPKKSVFPGQRVYIGKNPKLRDDIDHVKKRITAAELSGTANNELEYTLETIVMANQERFVKFYNEAESINLKKHMLEELPGLGKKTMLEILKERKIAPFKDISDINERMPKLKAQKLIVDRIALEIRDDERRRYLFVSR